MASGAAEHVCDVLVVGAGPAGSAAAREAARAGASVIVLDSRREVGVPVRCAEYIPFQLAHDVGLGAEAVWQPVDIMRTHLPDGSVAETEARGVICNRAALDQHLAARARNAGALFLLSTRAAWLDGEGAVVAWRAASEPRREEAQAHQAGNVTTLAGGYPLAGSGGGTALYPSFNMEGGQHPRAPVATAPGDRLRIRAQVIIGADGPASVVRKWMGMERSEFVHARQYVLPLARQLSSTEVYFSREFPGGYGWVFPKGEAANVGIGVDPAFTSRPGRALDRFVKYLAGTGVISDGWLLGSTGGLIPVSGQGRLRRGNMILAGDAGGHCHPVTGAGVANAVFAGGLAGEAAAHAAAAGDMEVLAQYEEDCRLFLGDTLQRAVGRREHLAPYWRRDDAELSGALRRGWIAFEGYYED